MKRSELFTKTSKTTPADEVSKNAELLIRAGYIYKEMAGVYAYLPLGLRVIRNIKRIVREEMNALGSQELIMTNLQDKATWLPTSRWDEKIVDVWFKTKLQDGTELGLAWSHEEPIMKMMQQFIHSYKDLPTSVYQFQTKLRNELRAKSGIMRGREFVMKDMYSLHASAEDLDAYYQKTTDVYLGIYDRLGLGEDTYVTYASGGAFTEFSHEFQTICSAGEDNVYIHRDKKLAFNAEVLEEGIKSAGIKKEELELVKCAEVGNIFNFGDEKARKMDIMFTNANNEQVPIFLGSYGIGITRLMGVIAEKFADEKGLIWPETVTPFKYYLIGIGENGTKKCAELYAQYPDLFLWDDRAEARPGEKFADAELMGIPYRVVISDKTLADNNIELVNRKTGETKLLTITDFITKLN
jgi:prolyl-tRNA synthetase